MSKNAIDKIVDAYEKARPNSEVTIEPVDGFPIGFTTDDLSTSMRDGKVNVTARLSKEDFDKIIYSYGVYILDYLSEKGLIKKDWICR